MSWARESAGYTIQEISKKTNIKQEKLKQIELGREFLTIRQLEKLANIYKRPVAIFFMKEIPQDFTLPDFRTKTIVKNNRIEGEINITIRKILEFKKTAESLYESMESNYDYSFLGTITQNTTIKQASEFIIKLLEINYEELKKLKDNDVLNKWKQWIERKNILVFQFEGIEPQYIRGFSFDEAPFPVIAINQKDSYYARCFTLIHELCHILMKKSGKCTVDEDIQTANQNQLDIEKFCNRVAENVLFPDSALSNINIPNNPSEAETKEIVESLSKSLKISYSVVLYKLYNSNKIPLTQFTSLLTHYSRYITTPRQAGGDYYALLFSRLSKKYIKEVVKAFEEKKITCSDFLDYLGISMKAMPKVYEQLEKEA